jgi:hypothetical protein
MGSFFSTVKFELGEHFESCGEAKMQLFDYLEVFYNQRRRHSTLGQISPAAFERRGGVGRGRCHPYGREERGHRDLEKPQRTRFPISAHTHHLCIRTRNAPWS